MRSGAEQNRMPMGRISQKPTVLLALQRIVDNCPEQPFARNKNHFESEWQAQNLWLTCNSSAVYHKLFSLSASALRLLLLTVGRRLFVFVYSFYARHNRETDGGTEPEVDNGLITRFSAVYHGDKRRSSFWMRSREPTPFCPCNCKPFSLSEDVFELSTHSLL